MNGNNNKANRITYIDTAKAYLIALVVIGHVLIVLNPGYSWKPITALQEFINAFHMPAFFIINGMLFDADKYRKVNFTSFLKSRVYTLIVPYVFFETLGIICRFAVYGQPVKTGLYNMLTVTCNVGADWFLPALFMGNVVFFLCEKVMMHITKGDKDLPKFMRVSILAAVSVTGLVMAFILYKTVLQIQFIIVINRALVALGFIAMGQIIRPFIMSEGNVQSGEKLIRRGTPLALLGVCAFVLTAGAAVVNLKIAGNDIYNGVIGNPLTLFVGGLNGTVMMLAVARVVNPKVCRKIGRHTLTIMGTHQIIIYVVTSRLPAMENNVGLAIVLLVTIAVLEVPIVWGIDGKLPFLVGRKKMS